MKNKRHGLICLLLVFLLLFQVVIPSQTFATECSIPLEAQMFAQKHYKEAIEVVKAYGDCYNMTENQLKEVKLGNPFVIYDLDYPVQDEIYYYPLLDSEGNVILTMSVMGTTEGWSISVSEEWVEELNQLECITSEVIFYKSGDNLTAENKQDEFILAGELNSKISFFSSKSYRTKKKVISDAINNHFVKTDISKAGITDTNRKDMYTPTFSNSTSSSKICSLHNKKNQENLGLCWAAAVSTICNYRNGTNIKPKGVADKMNIGYNKGATAAEAQQALRNYGVTYHNLNMNASARMSWDSLRTNIGYKCPVYVSAKSSKNGHAVTAYGYATAAGTNYVTLWNSGGNGNSISVVFKEQGTTFTYGNSTYIWTYSVSRY